MKKFIILLSLSLISYQGLATNNKEYALQIQNKEVDIYLPIDNTHKKILNSSTFIGDASLSSIEEQAQKKSQKVGASSYKIVGASGENQLRGHVVFYQ